MVIIRATRAYNPGDLIYEEEAFVHSLRRHQKNEFCEFCCKRSKDLIPCSKCKAVKYCGSECQEKDSGDHGLECAGMLKLQGTADDNYTRLLARVIFKVKGKDWKEISKNVMGINVSFEDLESQYDEMTRNPKLVLSYKEMKENLKQFIGEESLPEDEELIKIIGKVRFNAGNFSKDLPDLLCFGMGAFEHECIPNANHEACKNIFKVWAMRKIEPKEMITISHRNFLTRTLIRSPLNTDYFDFCKCTECSLPYGKSVLTRIIDENRAYSVIKQTEQVLQMADVALDLDLESDDRLIRLIDNLLKKHEEVLSPTNALYLKLLSVKVQMPGETNIRKMLRVMELERHVSSVFGEHFLELFPLYQSIIIMSAQLGFKFQAADYLEKINKLTMHRTED